MTSCLEKEVPSAQAATFTSAFLRAEDWTVTSCRSPSDESLPCTMLSEGTTIRVNPMIRQYDGWDSDHFHSQLRLPMECTIANGIVVTLEALARECVAVALSPKDSFELGKTYVIHFGAAGNSTTVIRRRLASGNEAVDVTLPGRVCSDQHWVKYWICLLAGHLYVGVGKQPGQQCLGSLDDSLYHQLRSGIDAVRFVGLGHSALGKYATALKVRNVCVCSVPEYLPPLLQLLPPELPIVNVDEASSADLQIIMEDYQKECSKAKKRAEKFGIPYKEPPPQASFQWSQAQKNRANSQKGFITGMDIMSPEQLEKQKARAIRFKATKREHDEDENTEQTEDDVMDEDVLSVTKAWENEELVREHRWDPPKSLWTVIPEKQDDDDDDKGDQYSMEITAEPLPLPEKVHICSIDWAAFKQIRTDDIMAYFSIYGPSNVEWLGEISCNVLFEDKFSAARALNCMSQVIPSPPPIELSRNSTEEGHEPYVAPDFGTMGWRFCQKPILKVTKDRYGRVGTRARIIMRVANSQDILVEKPTLFPKPPPGFTTTRVLGPGDDFGHHRKRQRRMPKEDDEDQDHPGLLRGLRSSRDGYSVDDMRMERLEGYQQGNAADEAGGLAALTIPEETVPWDEESSIAEA